MFWGTVEMTKEEAIKNQEVIDGSFRKIRSKKQRAMSLCDYLLLEKYIKNFETDYERRPVCFDFDIEYDLYYERLFNERFKKLDNALQNSDIILSSTKNLLEVFSEGNYDPNFFEILKYAEQKKYVNYFADFMRSMGKKTYTKYNELIKTGGILSLKSGDYGGICYDFMSLKTQLVGIDANQNQYDYFALAHEIGHVVHFHALNQVGRRNLETSLFVESLSTLYETLFLEYLEQVGESTENIKKSVLSKNFYDALEINMFCQMTEGRTINFNGNDFYFNEETADLSKIDTIPKYKEYYIDACDNLSFQEPLIYTLGLMISRRFKDEYGDDKERMINELLDFLIRSEYTDMKTMMMDINLESYVPLSLKKLFNTK
jgi:hypothetical protein